MNKGGFGQCRICGHRILFIRMESGKLMPVNERLVNYKLEDKGNDRIVTPDGRVVACISGVDAREADGYGYISHFATCPEAKRYRRKRRS